MPAKLMETYVNRGSRPLKRRNISERMAVGRLVVDSAWSVIPGRTNRATASAIGITLEEPSAASTLSGPSRRSFSRLSIQPPHGEKQDGGIVNACP